MRKIIDTIFNLYSMTDNFRNVSYTEIDGKYHYRFIYIWTDAKRFLKAYKSYIKIKLPNDISNSDISVYWESVNNYDYGDSQPSNLIDHTIFSSAQNTTDELWFDITKAVTNALRKDKYLFIDIVSNQNTFYYSEELNVITYYSTIFEDAPQKNAQSFPLANGNMSVDYFDGSVLLELKDIITDGNNPIEIRHVYNSKTITAGGYCTYLDDGITQILYDTKCMSGWKLNYQQRLIVEKKNVLFNDKETAKRYTWIRADGSQLDFNERYYYLDSDKAYYVNLTEIVYDKDLNLKTKNGSHDVYRVIKESNGYALNALPIDIENSEYVVGDDEIGKLENSSQELEEKLNGLQIEIQRLQGLAAQNSQNDYYE